jgi:type I restriction enzyme S subunit
MPAEWPTVRLEEIASTDRKGFAMGPFGSNIRSENYQQAGIPVLRGVNLGEAGFIHDDLVFLSEQKAEELKNSQAFPGDVIFVAQGTVGKVGLVPNHPRFQKTVLSQNLMKFSCDRSKCDPRFFYYFFVSTEGQHTIRSRVNPTGVPCISRPLSSLKEFEVPLPPLAEQKAIAAVLGALDDKIELNRQMNVTLEAMARALFQSWFVEFDPVRAKLDNRQPTGLDEAAAALFPSHFQDSEVGNIPAGWSVRPLGEVIDLGSGVPYEAKFKGDSGIPMITLGCVSFHDRFQEKGLTYYCGDYKETHVVKPDDLVVASHDVTQERKQLGSPAMVPRWLKGTTILAATNLYVVRNKSGFPNQFLYQLFRAEGFRHQMVASAKGTAILFISKDSILRYRLAWPPEELAGRFSAEAETLYSQYSTNAAQSRTLATLRDSLLPKLLSGEIRVTVNEARSNEVNVCPQR